MNKKTFIIEGMHCSSCAMTIDFDLEDIQGISKAVTSYAKQETVVEFDELIVTEEVVIKQIKKTGYGAKIK